MKTEFFTVNLKTIGEDGIEVEIVLTERFKPFVKDLNEIKNKIGACVKDIWENNISNETEVNNE